MGGIKKNSVNFFKATPAIGREGTIYFGSYDGNLYALNPDGTEKWRFKAGGGIVANPTIDKDGTIYFGSWDKKVYAIGPQPKNSKKGRTSGEAKTESKDRNGNVKIVKILGILATLIIFTGSV